MSEAGTKTNADAKWYIVHTYSNFEKKVAEEIKRQAKIQGLDESDRRRDRADRGSDRGAPRPEGQRRAQIPARLCAAARQADRRGLSPGQERGEGHGLSRPEQQADAAAPGRSRSHPQPGAAKARSIRSPRSPSRSASRCAWPTVRSPRSPARWKKSTKTARA